MSRNAGGTWSAPAGQPVVAGTVIDPTVFNNLVNDIGGEITDSLSRSGKGGMTAPLRTADGNVAAPAHSFTSEAGSGLYRVGAGDVGVAILGVQRLDVNASGVGVLGALAVASDIGLATAATQNITKSGGTLQIGTSDANEVLIVRNGVTVLATTSTSLDAKSRPIINVTDPTNAQDADTKAARAAAVTASQVVTNGTAGLSFNGTWSDYSARTRIYKQTNGIVTFYLQCTAGAAPPVTIMTLPAGYRPASTFYAPVWEDTSNAANMMSIDTAGVVSTSTRTNGHSYFAVVTFSTT